MANEISDWFVVSHSTFELNPQTMTFTKLRLFGLRANHFLRSGFNSSDETYYAASVKFGNVKCQIYFLFSTFYTTIYYLTF